MHSGNYVYTSRGFAALGHDVTQLANSALVEYCNNANNWGVVLTLVDAQVTLADDSWSTPGSWIDADMLTVGCNDNPIPGTPCSHGEPLTVVEEYSQFSLWYGILARRSLLHPPCSILPARFSLLAARCSLLAAPCSLLPAPCPAPCSLLPTP